MKITVEMFMNYLKDVYPKLLEDKVFKMFSELCDTRALKILSMEKEDITPNLWAEIVKEEKAKAKKVTATTITQSQVKEVKQSGNHT